MLVKENGGTLDYAHNSLKKDKDVVQAAVEKTERSFQYADSKLKKDKEFILSLLNTIEPITFMNYVDVSLKKDKYFLSWKH